MVVFAYIVVFVVAGYGLILLISKILEKTGLDPDHGMHELTNLHPLTETDYKRILIQPKVSEFCDDYMISLSEYQKQKVYRSNDPMRTLVSYLPGDIPTLNEYKEKYAQKMIQILRRIGYGDSFICMFSSMLRDTVFPTISEKSILNVLATQNAGVPDELSYFRDTFNYDNICCRALCGIAMDSGDFDLAEKIGKYMMKKQYMKQDTYDLMMSMVRTDIVDSETHEQTEGNSAAEQEGVEDDGDYWDDWDKDEDKDEDEDEI
jgi:hypothetical protein